MNRRDAVMLSAAALAAPLARAHHGWSSFDQNRPIYLEGKATKIAWRNPHAEFALEVAPDLKLPADLPGRAMPAQSAPVEGPKILQSAQLPTRKDRVWTVELAPISRLEAWKVAPIKEGETVGLLGYTFAGEKGDAVIRVEYLFAGGKVYGLRSSPA
jgi:hypothetical protein